MYFPLHIFLKHRQSLLFLQRDQVSHRYKTRLRIRPSCILIFIFCIKRDTLDSYEVKINLSLRLTKHHAMKTYWEWRYSSTYDLGARLRWVVSFTPRSLYPQGKKPQFPLVRRLGGPQSRSGRGGEAKNSQPSPGMEPWSCDLQTRSQ
jgi:hypothetical protein